MGKIYALFGKSCSGKSTIEQLISKHSINRVISFTTRDKRPNEINNIDYYFINNEQFLEKIKNDDFIEHRLYKNKWHYGIGKDEIDLSKGNWVVVVDVKGLIALKEYFSDDVVVGIYIHANDRERLLRYLLRDSECDVQEMIRRYNEDEKDFSDEIINGKYVLRINNTDAYESANLILRNIQNGL
jgi:guanylate kinase